MEAPITIKNLGDEKLENIIREQLAIAAEGCAGWTIRLTVPQNSDNWELTIASPTSAQPSVTVLTLHENQTVQRVVRIAIDEIALLKAAAQAPSPKVPNRATWEANEACERGEVFRAASIEELMADLKADD
jgi:hypothetical protein